MQDNALPCLRDMAQVVDASIETVSRVLGGLKQFDLLQGRKQQGGTVDAQHLRQFHFLPGMTSSSALGRQRCAQP
jgi:DNA-binding transcriptional regulator YhcF (GntR family)